MVSINPGAARPSRRAISLMGTPSVRCRRRISAESSTAVTTSLDRVGEPASAANANTAGADTILTAPTPGPIPVTSDVWDDAVSQAFGRDQPG